MGLYGLVNFNFLRRPHDHDHPPIIHNRSIGAEKHERGQWGYLRGNGAVYAGRVCHFPLRACLLATRLAALLGVVASCWCWCGVLERNLNAGGDPETHNSTREAKAQSRCSALLLDRSSSGKNYFVTFFGCNYMRFIPGPFEGKPIYPFPLADN